MPTRLDKEFNHKFIQVSLSSFKKIFFLFIKIQCKFPVDRRSIALCGRRGQVEATASAHSRFPRVLVLMAVPDQTLRQDSSVRFPQRKNHNSEELSDSLTFP